MFELDSKFNDFCGKTDDELAIFAKSDRLAADALVLRFSELIFIKAKLFSSQKSDRDDLCQEGLMGLLCAISSFDTERAVKFSTFAEVCIVNRMKSYAVKINAKVGKTVSFDDLSEETASQEGNPESICINKEFFSELWNAVEEQLSALEKSVFELFIKGNSYEKIALNLGISEKSVANAIQRARAKIRSGFNRNL